MTDQAKDTLYGILREYGFATLVACFLGYMLRADLILPMVESHRDFLKEIASTQREISQAVAEQTRLLYRLQPQAAEQER